MRKPVLRTIDATYVDDKKNGKKKVESYHNRHPINTMARLALELILFLGLRRSNVMAIEKKHI
ncbi:hypothetical protein [Candidatus Liberibacter solanacearum]|uniref:hypothetical protein n=1 Tax=Candidatus Liberibacter solanacearum TaxID=556287 RepID=UPI0012687A6D|nr:hypothetical protein [Candidatus Liberibacter solanacearum]